MVFHHACDAQYPLFAEPVRVAPVDFGEEHDLGQAAFVFESEKLHQLSRLGPQRACGSGPAAQGDAASVPLVQLGAGHGIDGARVLVPVADVAAQAFIGGAGEEAHRVGLGGEAEQVELRAGSGEGGFVATAGILAFPYAYFWKAKMHFPWKT